MTSPFAKLEGERALADSPEMIMPFLCQVKDLAPEFSVSESGSVNAPLAQLRVSAFVGVSEVSEGATMDGARSG